MPESDQGGEKVLPYAPHLKILARRLRASMTDAEQRLWLRLRRKQLHGHQFYRQKSIDKYIVDFYCPSAKIIIEVDGGQHYSESGVRKDTQRDSRLNDLGFRVIRFSDTDVLKNTDTVVQAIWQAMK